MVWNKLFARFADRTQRRDRRKTKRRKLLVESLTKRELLAADIGAIEGIAFVDDNASGALEASDTLLNNIQVELFIDTNGNNAFDPGTDLSQGTDFTDVNGVYRFDGLSLDTYFIQQAAVAGSNTPPVQQVEVIDDDGQQVQIIDNYLSTANSLAANPTTAPTETASFAAIEAIGGQRDVTVALDTTNVESGSLEALFNGAGALLLNAGGDAGVVTIQYDGVDGTSALDPTGLGGVSLAGGAATDPVDENAGLIIRLRSENAASDNAQIRVFTSATEQSTFNITIPAAATVQEVFVPFSDFTGNANFNDVGAIEAEVGLSLDNDVTVQIIETIEPVVVPANLINTPPQVDVTITKTLTNASDVQAGGTAIFEITVQNVGPDDATGVTVTDAIPDGLTFSAADSNFGAFTNTIVGSDLTVNIGDLAANSEVTFQIGTTITGTPTGDIINTAIVTVNENEPPNDLPNEDNELVDLTFADLGIVKDGPATANAGEQLTYTIEVTNHGPDSATDVRVTDNLPDGVTFVSATFPASGASVPVMNLGNNAFEFALGDFPNGQVTTFNVVVDVADDVEGDLLNTATVIGNPDNDPDLDDEPNDDDATVTLQRQVDVQIQKSVSGAAIAGGIVTYTLVATNAGPGVARGVQVTDTLDSNLTLVNNSFAATQGVATLANIAGQNLTFDIGTGQTLAVGESATFSFDVVIDAGAATLTGTIPNTATINTSDIDTNADNNTSTVQIDPAPQVDLVVTKVVDLATVTAGSTDVLTYTIDVSHDAGSISDAANVVVTDTLPDGVTFVGVVATGSTTVSNPNANNEIIVTYNDLPVGETRQITVQATVDADTTGVIVNPVVVDEPNDNNASNDNSSAVTNVVTEFDVVINKNVDDPNTIPGDTVFYTIDVNNSGPSIANNVVLTDEIPAGLAFQSATFDGVASGTVVGSSVVFPGIDLVPGGMSTAVLQFTVTDAASGTINNTASVTADNEANTTNNSSTANVTVAPQVDIVVTKAVDQANAQVGDTLTYSVQVTNNGPSTAEAVQAIDTLPAGVTFVSGVGPNGALTASNGQVIVNGGSLADNGFFEFTINAVIDASASGTSLINNVAVNTSTTEINTANNAASAQTVVDLVDPLTGSLGGTVFVDLNNNGVIDAGEQGIAGVNVTLTGTDTQGNAVNQSTTTNANGGYQFNQLAAGTYEVVETQPSAFRDGQEAAGQGAQSSAVGQDEFTQLVLGPGAMAVNFNFGELTETLSKRRFLASSGN